MAIVPLNKITLYGATSQKDAIIERLQQLGCVHIVPLGEPPPSYSAKDVASDARTALKFLRQCPEQRRQVRRGEAFDRQRVVDHALRIQRSIRELDDERDELQRSVADVAPWGEFRTPPAEELGGVRCWFYLVPLAEARDLFALPHAWREVSRDQQHARIVVLSEDPPQDIPGQSIELPSHPLSVLRARLESVEEQLEDLHHQRVGLTRWSDQLAGAIDAADDAAARDGASSAALDDRGVFAIRGWAPESAAEALRAFAHADHVAVTIEPPTAEDAPPTLLHNPEGLSGSEALVTFYKTPAYRSWDPSIIAFGSFAVFFAMIIADAGYGLVLGVLTALLWRKMGVSPGARRGRNVLAVVVGSTVVYGVLCGSYFGVAPPPDSLLGGLRIIDAQSQALMMPLSILIGVIHLSIAHLAAAWMNRGATTALASLGWVAVMIGATVAGIAAFGSAPESAADVLARLGAVLLTGGLVAVFLFSSTRPLLSLNLKNHALRVLDGLRGLTGLSGLFGDVLSYLRLFALGLSSAKLAETFNNLGAQAWDEAGFGVIVAIFIVLFGHTLNLLLSIMSGVVHGLRLNCIEFFKWGLPGEGSLFNAFAKKERQP